MKRIIFAAFIFLAASNIFSQSQVISKNDYKTVSGSESNDFMTVYLNGYYDNITLAINGDAAARLDSIVVLSAVDDTSSQFVQVRLKNTLTGTEATSIKGSDLTDNILSSMFEVLAPAPLALTLRYYTNDTFSFYWYFKAIRR